MSLWSRIAGFITGGASSTNRMLDIYVFSHRCREPIAGQVDLLNELSRTEDDSSDEFYTRKVLHTSGEKRCFDQVEVQLWFDRNKNITNHDVSGGRWLEENEYAEELARFNAPPEEESDEASLEEALPGDESPDEVTSDASDVAVDPKNL